MSWHCQSHLIAYISTHELSGQSTRRPGEACALGVRYYDFGNVRVGDQGLIQFKSKWGAEVKVIYRYSYLTGSHPTTSHHPVVSRTTTSTPNQPKRSAVRQLVFPLWQHLPLKAIELVGNGCHALHYY